jgi:hypothetical protein
MAGEVVTFPLKAGVEASKVFAVPPGAPVRLITPASSTAKVEVSADGGLTYQDWAFGTIPQSTTQEQRFPYSVVVRGVPVTGTATLEIDKTLGPPLLFVKGTPEGAVAAAPGTVAIRYDGSEDTIVYVKETGTGNTGWSPLTDAA